MKLNLKKIIFSIFAAVVILFNFAPLALAQSTDKKSPEDRCKEFYKGFSIDGSSNAVEGLPQYCTVNQLGTTVINIILALAGSALVLFIIVGGFLLITAGGNEEQSEKGKKVMTNAILGMVVVIMAFAIVKIVTNTLTGNVGQNTSGNTSGTNNTNNSNTTNSGGNGNNSGSGNNSSIDASILKLKSGINIPGSVVTGGTLNIAIDYRKTASGVPTTYQNDIKNICGGISEIGNNVSIIAYKENGDKVGNTATFSNNITSLNATISIPASSIESGKRIAVKICDVLVQVGTVTILP